MGFVRRLFRRDEKRSDDPSWAAISTQPSAAPINARQAENLSTVLACVQAISGTLASLPAHVYQKGERGRMVAWGHPLQRLIDTGPNEYQTWADFVEWLIAQALLRGNAVCEIRHDSRGAVNAIIPVPWERVTVHQLGSGRLAYDVSDLYENGRIRRLLSDEVLHLRDRTDDGIIGISRLSRAAEVVETQADLQTFTGRIYQNGVAPSGVIEADEAIGPEQVQKLSERLKQAFGGPTKAGTALVLDQGLKWRQLGVSPEDAELLASRRFSVEELARLFNVPPPVVGDLTNANYSNVQELTRFFARNTLSPWIRKLEQVFARDVFTSQGRRDYSISFDLSGLLRGDPEQRWQAHKVAIEAGVLDPDEVREVEGWNPRGGQRRATERYETRELTERQREALERKLAIRERYRPKIREKLAPIIQEDAEAVLAALESGGFGALLERFSQRGGDEGDIAKALQEDAQAMETEVRGIVEGETGQEVDEAGPFTSALIGAVATQYAAGKRAQVQALQDQPQVLAERAESWLETEADKLAQKVTVRVESGASNRLYRKAGRRRAKAVQPDGTAEETLDLEGQGLNNPPTSPGDERVLVSES